jgi:DNA-binding beta-propeller fold protein YncE
MRARRQVVLGLATLAVLALTVVPADALTTHAFVTSIDGKEAPSGSISPFGVAVDQSSGDVYAADSGEVDVFDSAGIYQPSLRLTGFSAVRAIGLDQATNDVYVADTGGGAVDVFNASSESVLQINGSETPAGFMAPFGVAVNDGSGDVYVSDAANGVVDVFNAAGVYQPSLQLTGTPPSAPVTGAFAFVTGVAVDQATGDVYVADFGNGVVDVFGPSGAYLSQINGSETPTGSMSPWGLGVDQANHELYVGDFGNGAVDSFNTAGIYEGQIKGSETPTGSMSPYSVTVGHGHTVYIADGEHAIDIFSSVVAPGPPSATTGAPSNIKPTSATVAGVVNPESEELPATCRVEYGTSISYGLTVPCSVEEVAAGTVPVPVTASLTGLEPNTTYHYRVAATNSQGTSYGKDETVMTAITVPVVSSELAASPSPTEVILSTTINTENSDTTYHFVYGTTAQYGLSFPAREVDLGSRGQSDVSLSIGELQPGTVYHYAVVASNPAGTTVGPDETFTTTPAVLPVVTTGAASGVAQNTATISGTVDPQGVQSTYEFDLGTDSSYGARVFGDVGSGSQPQSFTLSLQGLQPGSTYHYRLVASNAYGVTYGADQTFTTPGFPTSAIAAPGTQPLVATPLFSPPSTAGATTPKAASKAKPKRAKRRKKGRKASRAVHGKRRSRR